MSLSIEVSKLSTGTLENVALLRLVPSTTNPRKVFTGIEDLAASIKEMGLAQPMLVRVVDPLTLPNSYVWNNAWGTPLEVVIGGRRFRACTLAGLETVPVIIAKLTDEEAMELQVIENLQREDVHPLEEAEGYRALKKAPAIIAQRVTPGNKHITALLLQAAGSRDVFFLCDQLGLSGLLEPAALDEDGQEDYDARQDREEAAFQLLVDWMATANEESMERFAFLVRYAKVGVLNGWQLMHDKKRSRADLWQFASELGVDPAPIAQRVETQQKQKAAADRKAEAAAAKVAKKGGK